MNHTKSILSAVAVTMTLLAGGCGAGTQDNEGGATQTTATTLAQPITSPTITSEISLEGYGLSQDPKSAALFRLNRFGAVAEVRSVEQPSIPKLPDSVANPDVSGEQGGIDVNSIVSRRVEVVIVRPLVGGLREGELVHLRLLGGELDGIRVTAPSDEWYKDLEVGTTIVFFSTALVEYVDEPPMFTPNHLLVEHGSRFVPAGSSDSQGGLTADELQDLVNGRPAPPARP